MFKIFLFCLCFAVSAANAQTPPAKPFSQQQQELIKKIESYFNTIKTIKSKFYQISDNGASAQGNFYVLKPNKMRLEYDPPHPIEVIADGYYLIFPLTLRFLGTYQVSASVANQISLQSYISMFIWLILIIGVVFEMPSLSAILSRLGILTKSFLKKYRRHAVVILLIVAALITPSGDPFTLMAVGVPLYALYELSILVCRDIDK